MGFEPERLLYDPAAGLVRRGADEPVLGDREVPAVRGAQGQHPVAPVDQGRLGALRVGGRRRQVGAAGEQRRVEHPLRAAANRVRRRSALPHAQPYPVHPLGEAHALRPEPLPQAPVFGGAERALVRVGIEVRVEHAEEGPRGQLPPHRAVDVRPFEQSALQEDRRSAPEEDRP
ncbi:hypothetical protein ACFQ7J_10285 [Streptomyces sp. NPDC056501]|uniref:hypothetical protein n=1 Tax=Streptomyces sp. NPDC056501 TaxID=3345841 RepID=UPI0036C0E9D7